MSAPKRNNRVTEQVKRAKRQLKAAGFGRSDARVNVERRRHRDAGSPTGYFTEYGDAEIWLQESHAPDVMERASRLLEAGFDVTLHVIDRHLPRGFLRVEEAPTYERAPRFQALYVYEREGVLRLACLSRDPAFAVEFAERIRERLGRRA